VIDQGHREYRVINAPTLGVVSTNLPDGSILLKPVAELESHPYRFTSRLKHWALETPDQVILVRRNEKGGWDVLTYAQVLDKVECIAWHLLQRSLSNTRPLVILSENSMEHALMTLAALHVGIPCSALSPAYSLRATDFSRLKYMINLLTPGLIFVQDGEHYKRALQVIAGGMDVVVAGNPVEDIRATWLDDLFSTSLDKSQRDEVERAHESITPDSVAKILFTSGSTDVPKAVINTHGNITTNWQQIARVFPFLTESKQEFVDWLPWSHTYGSNHNFGLCMYLGGTFVIDDGNPTPAGVMATVANLRERKPTVYFSVPRGLEVLVPYFRNDPELRKNFFSELQMLFFAGASMSQHVWDAWQELAMETMGHNIVIATGLGCTESCPGALFFNQPGGYEGVIGLPAPGLEVKLVPKGEKMEVRYRGKNITPGYWRQPELTECAFDEDHFYCTGDAVKFVDQSDPAKGLLFDGRLTEDFKLSTGTWVNAGSLRSLLILEAKGLIQDVVITGHNRLFAGAIVFLNEDAAKQVTGTSGANNLAELAVNATVRENVLQAVNSVTLKSSGSSLIRRALIADFNVRPEKGELTEKGSINQSAVIRNYPELVERIHAETPDNAVLEIAGLLQEDV
jgi:feruloyl-CoA synthase